MPLDTQVTIGPYRVSGRGRALVIAEAGVNHNGDLGLAIALVRAAKASGADCVKFQTFRAGRLVAQAAPKAAYQMRTTDPGESQLEMLKGLELSPGDYEEIIRVCGEEGIVFLSTPYSAEDVDLLESLGVPAFKIASGQAVEPVFLEYVARRGKPVLLSTGMCSFEEVRRGVSVIRDAGNDQIVVLQCTTNYPSGLSEANLRAMVAMRDGLGLLTGYSDHTVGLTAAVVAVGLGACVIEKHFTVDKTLPGPDQCCSSHPQEFAEMVRMIREAEQVLGSSVKAPTELERRNMRGVRRGIVAATRIAAGERFTLKNLAVKRPMSGLSAMELPDIVGRAAAVHIETDTPVTAEMLL